MALRLLAFALIASTIAPAEAQCARVCAIGQARDPYGCCIPVPRPRARRPPESLVGDDASVLADDAATELYQWARAWLSRARTIERTSHARAVPFYWRAANMSLVFLSLAPNDPRAGRMRVVLIQGLDGAGLEDEGDREAAALGAPRSADEPAALRAMRADFLLILASEHAAVAGRLDASAYPTQHARAITRYRRASDYYALYVDAFPDLAPAPGARSALASALIAAGDPLSAAHALEALAEIQGRRIEALRRTVDAYQRALDLDVQSGRSSLRSDAPPPSQRPPWTDPLVFPPELQRFYDANERYLAETAASPEPFWRSQALANVLWLYRYGRFSEAERRLNALLTERCDDSVARNAWTILASMNGGPPNAEPSATEICAVQRRARCADAPDSAECVAVREPPPR